MDGSVNLLTDSNDSTCQFHFVIHKLHSNIQKMCELKVTFLVLIYIHMYYVGTAFLTVAMMQIVQFKKVPIFSNVRVPITLGYKT